LRAACPVPRPDARRLHATRNTQQDSGNAFPHSRRAFPSFTHHAPRTTRAFTLIEIMIVVAILAIVMTVAIPAFVSAQNRRPMRLATEGLLEACATARAQAILRGSLVELRIRPQDYTFEVAAAGAGAAATPSGPRPEPKAGDGHGLFNLKLPEEIGIEELAVNFQLLKEAEAVAVRFQPNGTSDEFTVVIRSLHGELRKVTLDPVTGRAHFDVLR
jgi:type II secretion system protein H